MFKKLLTAPSSEPILLAYAKAHLVIEHSEHDELLESFIQAARENIEDRLGRAVMRQKWRLYLDDFEDEIDLEPWTVREVESVNYTDTDGADQVASTSLYTFDLAAQRLLLAYDQDWPDVRDIQNAVWIDVWSGFYDETVSPVTDSVPHAIKAATSMLVGWLYEHRLPVSEVELFENAAFDALIAPYRVIRI